MEWRQQTSLSCAEAFNEAQRWIEEVTGKLFGCNNFRAALENGVLLCDLINQLKPGIIKRLNRLSTPIAGLDNVNVFLRACEKLGLNESQLFHPGDLQDLSTRITLRRDEGSRRLKNVLITIYWLGRKAHLDPLYSGPQLNFKAFEGLLGLALSKTLDEGGNVFVKDSWYPERGECQRMGPSCKRENSVDSVGSLDSRALRPNSEGCGSDAEAEQVFKMETAAQQIQNSIPLLQRKQRLEDNGKGCASPLSRSKSLSDIPMVYPVRRVPKENTIYDVGQDMNTAREWNQENRQNSVTAEDTEAQWRDDLTKWKDRRRSTKPDIHRMSQDREHVINQMTSGIVTNMEKNEGKLLMRNQQSPHRHNPAPLPSATSPSSQSSANLRPRTRALLARSYATEAPFCPTASLGPHNLAHSQGSSVGTMPASDRNILREETHCASLASDGTGVTTPSPDLPFSSKTKVKTQGSPSVYQTPSEQAQPENVLTRQTSTLVTTIQPLETRKSTTRDAYMLSHKELPKVPPVFPDASGQTGNEVKESLSQEESQKTSWEPAEEQGRDQQAAGLYKYLSRPGSWSRSASLPRGFRRSEGSTRLSSAITARPFGTKPCRVSPLPRLFSMDDNQGLCLNSEGENPLSPPSQVAFQTSTYYHQTQLQSQPYSNPQSNSNTSTGLPSTKVDHSDRRLSLTLKPNNIANFGFQTHWDSTGARVKFIQTGSPAELCQLCVGDEIVAVDGVAVAHMSYSQWKDKMTHALQTGSLTMDIRRYGNKDWRTSEGSQHNQLGQSRMALNLTATTPVRVGRPDHHVNSDVSVDTTVAKLSKINGQTDNVIQGKVIDGELADSHRTAKSKGGSESAISDLQVPSLNPSTSSWLWDPEEDRRHQERWQAEQERLLQEQYRRDQERLEAEWRKAQQDARGELCIKSGNTYEMANGSESSASTQFHVNGLKNKTKEEERNFNRDELKEAGSKPQSNARGAQNDKLTRQEWTKSLSTPALSAPYKQIRGDQRKRKGQSLSKAEKERQEILEEMKQRTQLLTDNSWIRSRNPTGSFHKEPVKVPLKRYDSLDNLDTLHESPVLVTTFSYPRPHSAAAGYSTPSRNFSSRYSTGAIVSQRNPPTDSSHHARMLSDRRTCCVCERTLGSGAAMVIEALNLCFHLSCFQCVGCRRRLRGAKTGVQVRIRNEKPYCEPCYFQLKSTGSPSM
uniref:LIM domain only protein 7b isoform X3 n=1 Tax=Monopterus albus TaxID=43700 RepID=UPI0009B34CF3|nr:LIM domain only protein 7-like isoform X3 [Monopterus albus]